MKSHLFFLVSMFFFTSVGWAAAATPGDVSSPVPPPDIFSEILSRPPDGAQPQAPLPNTMNCFDHYRFGSVQADFSAVLAQALPGTEMTFSGTIQNNNPYPIVDGSVYVKIFRVVDEDESLTHRDGYPVVDQFSLPQSFHIPAQGKRAASFQWLIPANAPGGEYFAAFYFQSAKRYNLLGLSFTDDVTGNQAPFRVTHPNAPEKVSVNKHTVTLNGSGHSFVGFPRHFSRGEAVTATVDIENPKSESTAVMIDWNLYAWDGLREETLSGTETQIVELKAGEKKTVSYTVPPASTSVSYLVFQMHDGFSNSFFEYPFRTR